MEFKCRTIKVNKQVVPQSICHGKRTNEQWILHTDTRMVIKADTKRETVTFAQCSCWFFHYNEMFCGNLQCFRDQPLNVSNIFMLPEVKMSLRWRRFQDIKDARKNRATKLYAATWDAIDDFCVTFRKIWKCCSQGRLLWMKIK